MRCQICDTTRNVRVSFDRVKGKHVSICAICLQDIVNATYDGGLEELDSSGSLPLPSTNRTTSN